MLAFFHSVDCAKFHNHARWRHLPADVERVEKASIDERQPLPDRYRGLDDAEMDRRIAAARATLGSRLLILGHHYQRDEVIKFADYVGDSFKLSRYAARAPTRSS